MWRKKPLIDIKYRTETYKFSTNVAQIKCQAKIIKLVSNIINLIWEVYAGV